jgi:hypothetical protein
LTVFSVPPDKPFQTAITASKLSTIHSFRACIFHGAYGSSFTAMILWAF